MQKDQCTFTREFKVEAVQLAKSSEKPLTQIARDLGIAASTLHHWCKLFSEQGEQAFPGSGYQRPQHEGRGDSRGLALRGGHPGTVLAPGGGLGYGCH